MIEFGVLILGGGEATRLPGKLELRAGHTALIARVARNLAAAGDETYVACRATFPFALDEALAVPMVVDRFVRRGPLGGVVSTMARMRARWIFTVGGDLPYVDARFVAWLRARRRAGDEAVVPAVPRAGAMALEPLAALYDRLAFLREGSAELRGGRGAMHAVVARLRARIVAAYEPELLYNVNTPDDYAGFANRLERAAPA